MNRTPCSKWWPAAVMAAVALALLAQDTRSGQGKAEDEVKDAFVQLQGAIKAKDPAKIWPLLDSATQADAERTAKIMKGVYSKADAKGKAKQEAAFGLSADDFAKLDTQMLLRSKPFKTKYDEIADSKITGITVQGDTATLNYLEPDGDKEKLTYTRQDGKWKAAMQMPKPVK
jgi:hypothetical protein